MRTLCIFFFYYISLLYLGFVTIIFKNIVLIFIYDDDVCFSSPTFICVVSSLSLYACFFMYAIFISVLHMMPWWVCLSVSERQVVKVYHAMNSLLCKVFQEFVVGIDLFCNTTSGYKLSNLRLLSWLVVLLWFCHGLPKGEIIKDIFYIIG